MGQKTTGTGPAADKARKIEKQNDNPKQIRARARRKKAKGDMRALSTKDKLGMLKKPIPEWDIEELSRGRVRDKNGHFTGAKPQWLTADIHERAMVEFKKRIKTEMGTLTPRAVKVLSDMMDNDDVDEKGKAIVAPGVKKDIAFFLVEHLIGKPTQEVKSDISIRLQAVLGGSMVIPGASPTGYIASSSHRELDIVDAEEVDDSDLGLSGHE